MRSATREPWKEHSASTAVVLSFQTITMSTNRREFLIAAGLAFAAAVPPTHSLADAESSASSGLHVVPFVQIGRTRITGVHNLAAHGWQFTVADEDYPGGKRYCLAIRNTACTSRLLDGAGFVLLPPLQANKRQWRVFLDSGHSGWCGVKPLEALEPDNNLQPVREQQPDGSTVVYHQSDMQSVVWDTVTGTTWLVGFLRQRHGRNLIHVVPNERATDIRRIEAVQELGFEIGPGREQPLDPLVTSLGSNPYLMLEMYGDAVARYHEKQFEGPPIVGMMTWYGYRTAIDEQIVLDNAKLISGLFGGYPQKMQVMMLCDHGWQQDANWGYWEPDKTRFPHGMKWLAGQLRSEGVALGLWYTPFCLTENAQNRQELVPLESLDNQGAPETPRPCVWGQLPGQPDCMKVTFFDGGNPLVQQMWRRTLGEMKQWGTFSLIRR
jgi:hypothetical protein